MTRSGDSEQKDKSGLTRRQFIIRTAIASTVVPVGVAAYLGSKSSRDLVRPKEELYVLDDISFGVLVVFAAHILDADENTAQKAALDIDRSLRFTPPETHSDIKLVLAIFENALSGWFLRGQAVLFSELTSEARELAIEKWSNSSLSIIRGATNSLRKLCMGVYYADLNKAKALGYLGPQIDKPDPGKIEAHAPISSFSIEAIFESD